MSRATWRYSTISLPVRLVVVRKHIGIGHVQDLQAEDAGLLLQVGKVGIGKFDVPIVVVEGRVIDAVRSFGAYVGRWHPKVLNEWGVVRPGTQIAHANVFFCSRA